MLAPHIDALVDGLLGQGAVVRLDEVDLVVAGGDGLEAVSLFPSSMPFVLDVPSLSCGKLIHHLLASIPAILPGLLDPVVLVGRLVGPPLLLPGVDLELLLVHPVRHALN